MMKDVVIIANFCRDFFINDNGRFTYICEELSNNQRVEIITSDFCHGEKRHKKPIKKDRPYVTTFIHEPGYPTNVCVKRFYSHFIWGLNVKKYLEKRKKPDVIYCAIPSLTASRYAAKYCKKNKVKFIIDIQDLWPEAFKMVFSIPIISNLLFAPFNWISNGIYKKADKIVAVSDTYVKRALKVNKKCKNGCTVFLGTNLDTFDNNVRKNLSVMSDSEVILGYCGTLGSSYDLECVFDALKIIRDKGIKPPKFLIMGDGPKRYAFETYAKESNIDVIFTGRLPYEQMCSQLSKCDIVINPIKHGSAASIINKHADYAASGLPIINSQDSPEYCDLLEKYDMGFNCNNEDAFDMAEKLELLLLNKEVRLLKGKNARRCAEEMFDRKYTYKKIINLIVDEGTDIDE